MKKVKIKYINIASKKDAVKKAIRMILNACDIELNEIVQSHIDNAANFIKNFPFTLNEKSIAKKFAECIPNKLDLNHTLKNGKKIYSVWRFAETFLYQFTDAHCSCTDVNYLKMSQKTGEEIEKILDEIPSYTDFICFVDYKERAIKAVATRKANKVRAARKEAGRKAAETRKRNKV